MIEITENDWESEVINSDIPVLVDFSAMWCSPCKKLFPIVEQISKDFNGKIKVVKVDIDNSPNISNEYKIRSVPTLMVFQNGQKVSSITGLVSREKILEMLSIK